MIPRMTAVANEHGIDMKYEGRVGNTFDSHRLIWRAREDGGSELQDKVVESLFQAYFEEGKSLGETTVLRDCALNAGMENSSPLWADPVLGKEEVRAEIVSYGREFECTGVPMFIVDGKYVLNGAQEGHQFLRVFEKLG